MRFRPSYTLLMLFIATQSLAQQQDFGIWLGANLSFSPLKKWTFELAPEMRFSQNSSIIEKAFADIGIEYKLFKFMKVGGFYRGALHNERTHFEGRNRFFANVQLSHTYKKVQLSYRFRYQQQFSDFTALQESGPPSTYYRHKFGVELNLPKKLTFASGADFWISNRPEIQGIRNLRWTNTLSWDFSKKQRIELSYLFDQGRNISDPLTMNILRIQHNFKL